MQEDPTELVHRLASLELQLHRVLVNRVVTVISSRGDRRGKVLWVGDGEVIILMEDGAVQAFPYGSISRIKVRDQDG